MGVKEIPRSFEYTCDRCGAKHVQENASGHYTNSTPIGWGRISVRTANVAMGNRYEDYLLCAPCYVEVEQVVTEMITGKGRGM